MDEKKSRKKDGVMAVNEMMSTIFIQSLVSYYHLPEAEKDKDRNTINLIPQLLSLIDYQVYQRKK